MSDKDTTDLIRARQRSRARVMGLLLAAFVILIFAISIVKITQGEGP
jgi:predicted tellurium resistance membrane protein TerC